MAYKKGPKACLRMHLKTTLKAGTIITKSILLAPFRWMASLNPPICRIITEGSVLRYIKSTKNVMPGVTEFKSLNFSYNCLSK